MGHPFSQVLLFTEFNGLGQPHLPKEGKYGPRDMWPQARSWQKRWPVLRPHECHERLLVVQSGEFQQFVRAGLRCRVSSEVTLVYAPANYAAARSSRTEPDVIRGELARAEKIRVSVVNADRHH